MVGYGAGNPLIPRGSDMSYAAARTSAVGVTMDLGFNPKLDKSGIPNLNAIFNEGDVSMMDEMNRLVTGFSMKNRDSDKDRQPPNSKEGSGSTVTRKMSPIQHEVNALERPRLSDERYSHLNF